MLRTQLYADPHGLFLHNLVLDACRRNREKTALIDTSCGRRMTFADYGDAVESVARGLIAAAFSPAMSWRFFYRIPGSSAFHFMPSNSLGQSLRC